LNRCSEWRPHPQRRLRRPKPLVRQKPVRNEPGRVRDGPDAGKGEAEDLQRERVGRRSLPLPRRLQGVADEDVASESHRNR
jgi:hypothetical protein